MVDSKQNLAKSIDMANNAADKMWDLWLAGLKTYDWSHEKLDNMARVQLDLNKAAREDAIRMLRRQLPECAETKTSSRGCLRKPY